MFYGSGNLGSGFGGNYGNTKFICLLSKYIGETVTIFTTSGGASGCGFTGILLAVNCDFVRISTMQGTPPANPLSPNICPHLYGTDGACGNTDYGTGGNTGCNTGYNPGYYNTVGSVCDIPIDRIASFCHNAV